VTRIPWVASDVHRLHDPRREVWAGMPRPHLDVPARADVIADALAREPGWQRVAPTEHGTDPITRVHDAGLERYLATAWDELLEEFPDYDEFVPDTILHPALLDGMEPLAEQRSALGRLGQWCFETMTPIRPGTYRAAREAVDVALTAVDLVSAGEPLVYGLCRPPGHHVPRAAFGGYCYFNNAAIAAEALVRAGRSRVAILDVDVHHGNGTQQIFFTRPDILYVSLHADPARTYPYFTGYASERGSGAGTGTTLNLPLPERVGDAAYAAALDVALDAIRSFGPDALVVSLGLDTYQLDPIGDLGLTTGSYRATGGRVGELRLPTVVLQEGGYHVGHLGSNAVAWLEGAAGRVAPGPG
jgi:acetoin utilization deacetylase AcuC-like enzyme